MKKLSMLAFIAISLGLGACKKKGCTNIQAVNFDTEAEKDDGSCNFIPTITLNGESTVTIGLSDTYTDAGATATNQDGSTVTVTDDSELVTSGLAGTYTITYTASNEHGNATATRTVIIEMNSDDALGDYTCASDCGATQFPVDGARTIGSGVTSNSLVINDFFTLVGGTANATLDGQTLSFPNQTIAITGGDITFSGTGEFNSAATSVTVNFTYDNTVPFVGGSGTCSATYSK
ncbi:MAG: DUF5011 domain-containing protein [Crocinitomicaceae bacterium]|nr:DUF5011 domain-containing protein [Crocinitomicaceae bacterium]